MRQRSGSSAAAAFVFFFVRQAACALLTLTSTSTWQLQQKHLLQPTTEAVAEVEAAQPTVAGKFIRSHRRTSHRETETEREREGENWRSAVASAAVGGAASRPVHAELQSNTRAEAAQTFILLFLVNKLGSCASSATIHSGQKYQNNTQKNENNKPYKDTYVCMHIDTGRGKGV